MKPPKFLRISLVLVFAFSLAVSQPGCETITKYSQATTSANVANKIVVDAEKLALLFKLTSDTYLGLEKDHRDFYSKITGGRSYLLSVKLRERIPDPTVPDDRDPPIRLIPRAEAVLKVLRKATYAFENAQTADAKANLMTAIATVRSLYEDIVKMNNEVKSAGG